MHPLRSHPGYLAALAHRISGLVLALFLPAHFLLLGTALEGVGALDSALAFTDNPVVKIAEWGLVVLLALHLFFGVRLLVLELAAPARLRHGAVLDRWVTPGLAAALLVGGVFMIHVL